MKLTVNGVAKNYDGDPQMPILWFLRDELKLTGTKFGCGRALCGACTVHLNGRAVRACVMPMSAAADSTITTIEGIDAAHPLKVAWKTHNVPQCGYCQSGQIMQAADLLSRNAAPSDNDIDLAMTGNICRCGTYTRIKTAIKTAAEVKS